MRKIGSGVVKSSFVALMLCLTSASAFADLSSFNIQGSTNGQFYLGSTNVPLGTNVMGLGFTGSTINTTVTPPNGAQVLLGTFSLDSWAGWYDPIDFKLSVDLTAPTVSGTVFKADLSGLVLIGSGSATIDFTNNTFHFAGLPGSGTFDLTVSDVVTVANGKSANVMGTISNTAFNASPEPTTLLLTTALLGGVVVVFRKRLRSC